MRSELLVQVAFSFQLYLSLLFLKSFHGVSRLSIGILEGQLPCVWDRFILTISSDFNLLMGKYHLSFFFYFLFYRTYLFPSSQYITTKLLLNNPNNVYLSKKEKILTNNV